MGSSQNPVVSLYKLSKIRHNQVYDGQYIMVVIFVNYVISKEDLLLMAND